MTAAPVASVDPATTSNAPAEYLWAPEPRRGTVPCKEAASSHTDADSASASGGMPMSTTATSPAYSVPGVMTHPSFAACAQTVRSACTASPHTSPVEASTPDGTSTATVKTSEV